MYLIPIEDGQIQAKTIKRLGSGQSDLQSGTSSSVSCSLCLVMHQVSYSVLHTSGPGTVQFFTSGVWHTYRHVTLSCYSVMLLWMSCYYVMLLGHVTTP